MATGFDDGRYARACLSAFIECGAYHPTGNCSHPRWIRLHVDGLDWQVGEVATALKRLTALPQRAKDSSGDMRVPLTWAMVTQLSKLMEEHGYGWAPDPGLNRWTEQEFLRRYSEFRDASDLKFDAGSLKWTPMPHQLAGAYVGALNKRFFFADDTRCGKTATALLTLAELEARGESPFPAFVVCPASVVDPWLEELELRFPDWPAVAFRGPKRKNLSSRYKVYVMSWDTFRTDMKHEHDELPSLLKFLVPRTVVMDEAHALCCRADAVVQTKDGGKRICEVREGDWVRGVDHETGQFQWTQVTKAGRSPLRPTVKLGDLELTPDHPVWVSASGCVGYAAEHDEDIHLREVRGLVRAEVAHLVAGTEILLSEVPVRGGEGKPGPASSLQAGERGVASQREVAAVPALGQESVQRSYGREDQGARERDEQGAWVSGAERRERGAYYPAGAVAEAARLGVHPRVLSRPGSAATGLPDELQGGPGLSSVEASDRTGRELAPAEAQAGTRQEEGSEAHVSWLDCAEVLEYGSPEESLWNLSTGTGNYVAAGILVHNCNVKTRQSVAAQGIARVTEFAFLMSGTPITKDVGGFWRALSVLDIRSFPDEDKYKDRYTDRYHSDYGRDEVTGLSPATMAEFHVLMQGSMRRVSKHDVNRDFPERSYSTRVVELPPLYRAAYEEMAEDMLAHLPDVIDPLEVMDILTQLHRLTQLASSACDVEIEMVTEMRENHPLFGQEVPKQHVTMREPSWKVDELMALTEESQGSPLLVFSPHTQLVKIAGARAERAGYSVGYVTGGQSAAQRTSVRKAFQAGELDLLCANVTAGGVGLTLNRGDTVVFLERPWAYWQAYQAESRADDIINAKQVHVIDIVAANTVESRVRQAMKDKSKSLAELVRDPRIVEEFLGGQSIHVK